MLSIRAFGRRDTDFTALQMIPFCSPIHTKTFSIIQKKIPTNPSVLCVNNNPDNPNARIQRGGDRGSGSPPPPLKNYKNIGFLSHTGQDSLKMTKLPSQHSMSGHHQNASKTPFKWHFADRLMMAHLLLIVSFGSSHKNDNNKKNLQSWTPSGKTFWIRA